MTRFTALAALPLLLAACSPDAAPESAPAPAASTPTVPVASVAPDPSLPTVVVYKSPTCGCCASWTEHLRARGFPVETIDRDDITEVKDANGVPAEARSCHTAIVDGYVVEGHVPVEDIERLLTERPDARGLAVPGMPLGSPGMEQGDTVQPYDVLLLTDAGTTVFAHHGS